MKKIFYEKRGNRYYAVNAYDNELMDSFPEGCHLIVCKPGSVYRRFNIDPNFAALIAAGKYAQDAMVNKIVNISQAKPSIQPLTEEQKQAWDNLKKVYKNQLYSIQYPSALEIAETAISELQSQAANLLKNEAVIRAYDNFMLMVKLSSNHDD